MERSRGEWSYRECRQSDGIRYTEVSLRLDTSELIEDYVNDYIPKLQKLYNTFTRPFPPRAKVGWFARLYKKLIAELSEHLVPEDLKQIIFLRSLPDILKNSSALDVLEYMEKHGKLSPTDIQSLSGLLKDVHRNDLVNKYVEEYQRKFGEDEL